MDIVQWVSPVLGLIFVVAVVFGLFAIYVAIQHWVWRMRGKGFAEGWFMVVDEREGRTLKAELYPGQRRQVLPQPGNTPAPAASMDDKTAARIRDAGHRWLGNTK